MSYGTKNYQEKVDLTESFCWIILTVVKRKMCNLPVIWEFASKDVKEAKKNDMQKFPIQPAAFLHLTIFI